MNQRSSIGLPQVWQPDDTGIECNITATAMQEAVLIDGVQACSHNGEFEDIDEEINMVEGDPSEVCVTWDDFEKSLIFNSYFNENDNNNHHDSSSSQYRVL